MVKHNRRVSIKVVAHRLGINRARALDFIKQMGIKPRRQQMPDSRHQRISTITVEQLESAYKLRSDRGFACTGASKPSTLKSPVGLLYIIQLVPDIKPTRVKIGHAESVAARLVDFKVTAPTASILVEYPCRPSWEIAARESIMRTGAVCVGGEVFDVKSLATIRRRAKQFFALMPKVD